MDLVKSVSKCLDDTPAPSFLTQLLMRSRRHSNSSIPTPDISFTPFWEKEETTGTTRLKELLCAKHQLRAYLSVYRPGKYVFICRDCGATFYVDKVKFKEAWTREDIPAVLDVNRIHWWEEGTGPEEYTFLGSCKRPGNSGVLGFDY